MDPITVSLIALGVMIVMLCTGVPVALAVGVAALGGFCLLSGGLNGLSQAAAVPWHHAFSFTLMALPLFILMGFILERIGITGGMFRFVSNWVGQIPGSLGLATLLSCGIFAAVCGSGTATAATMSTICYPHLEKYKYNRRFIAGLLNAGGSLGPVIPPSGAIILYGVLTGQSVAKLFAAAIIPGILVIAVMSLYIMIASRVKPTFAPKPPKVTWGEKISSVRFIAPFLVLIFLVLGGIYLGWATPTEAASLGAFGALGLMVSYGRFNARTFQESIKQTVLTSAFILIIVTFALMLGDLFKYAGLPQWLAKQVISWGVSYWGVFTGLIVIYLVMGMFLDPASVQVITIPLLAPVLELLGFDLILFGVVLVLLIEVGTMTPPFALHVFVIQGVTNIPYQDCIRGALPFAIIWVVVILLVVAFPSLALWFPSVLY